MRDNFRAVEYVSSLTMFLIAVKIEVVIFSDMVNNPFVKSILRPSQISSFWRCHKNFSSFITKPHFTKEILTVLASALEVSKIGAVPNRSSMKTCIFILFCLQNFTKHCITLVDVNGAEYRPKRKTLKAKHSIFSPNSYAKPKNFLWFAFISIWIENLSFPNIFPLFSSRQISLCPYTHAY